MSKDKNKFGSAISAMEIYECDEPETMTHINGESGLIHFADDPNTFHYYGSIIVFREPSSPFIGGQIVLAPFYEEALYEAAPNGWFFRVRGVIGNSPSIRRAVNKAMEKYLNATIIEIFKMQLQNGEILAECEVTLHADYDAKPSSEWTLMPSEFEWQQFALDPQRPIRSKNA